jgi:hypothetical protein
MASSRSKSFAASTGQRRYRTVLRSAAAPNGRTDNGLPIGVQIIGGYLEDRTTMPLPALLSANSEASNRRYSSQAA